MFAKLKDFFDRAHSKRLEEILKENEKEFKFNLGNYLYPAVGLATIGCLFFHQFFWFACITIGVVYFSTLLKQVHDLEDKSAYEEFLDICVRKEGIVFSIVMIISQFVLSILSISLLNYMLTFSNGIFLFIVYAMMLAFTIMITSAAVSSVARLIIPLVIKKSRSNDF
ncbi:MULTISPECIES: hypothetical protein [Staphylococcus]|uniref:hypothetical protein n=1 Tax=Staphylococcus TaxID=1279 RepID=UPI00024C2E3E|nr:MULTISPECIES: hypothetical protein [Staphylococcus]EHQ77640.1 hypothetical protein SEVCU065_2508 [Staphylococcus epidermidis VCU065]KDP61387.1 hypothetical protein SEVCU013_0174 [Staphylococcus epidermidis VCU013]PTI58457.1 hypothetical protein BU090_11425 [Staphylococcus warneri]